MVLNKIAALEKDFRTAYDFAYSETGQGLDAVNDGSFETHVRIRCKYYYELIEIMGERASCRAVLSTDREGDLELDDTEHEFLVVDDGNPDDSSTSTYKPDDTDDDDGGGGGKQAAKQQAAAKSKSGTFCDLSDDDDDDDDDDNIDAGQKSASKTPLAGKQAAKQQAAAKSKSGTFCDLSDDDDDDDDDDNIDAGQKSASKTPSASAKKKQASALVSTGNKKKPKQPAKPAKKQKHSNATTDTSDETARSLRAAIEERKRHNRAAIEERKRHHLQVEKALVWDERDKQQTFEMKVYQDYRVLVNDGLSTEEIIELFPDMAKYAKLNRKT